MSDIVERRWIGKETVGPACLTRLERVAEIWRDQGMTVTEWVPIDALEAAQARIEAVRGETVEVQNPIEELRLAALTVFPDLNCLVRFAAMPEEGPYGETFWPADGGRTLVHVAVGIPMEAVIEVMAHELAHVAAGPDADHGPAWEEAFEQIHAAYCARALTEAKEDRT